MRNETFILVLVLSGLITFSLRAVPFVLFGRKKEAPVLIRKLGDLLPYAVIAAFVVYCLKDVTTAGMTENIKTAAAVIMVSAVHLWKKDTILSIAVGTVFYMILLHI